MWSCQRQYMSSGIQRPMLTSAHISFRGTCIPRHCLSHRPTNTFRLEHFRNMTLPQCPGWDIQYVTTQLEFRPPANHLPADHLPSPSPYYNQVLEIARITFDIMWSLMHSDDMQEGYVRLTMEIHRVAYMYEDQRHPDLGHP